MISDLIAGVFLVALLYILVKPGSQGSAFISAFTAAATAVIGQVTDIANGTDTDSDSGDGSDDTTQGN